MKTDPSALREKLQSAWSFVRTAARRIASWRSPILLRRGVWLYLLLIAVAILYTQMLRSPASNLFFWFLILVPFFSLLYILTAKFAVKVYVGAEKAKTEKLSPLKYELKIINEFILPFPLVEAWLSLPQKDGIRCERQCQQLSLIPLGVYSIEDEVTFRFRGTYEIGVEELLVIDPLRLFAIRLDFDLRQPILVLPRRLRAVRESITSATDVPTDSARVVQGAERSEIGNIRDYRNGDALKSIHWKLSSKTDDLQVKEYNTNTARSVYVLVDFARAPEETPAEPETRKKTPRATVRQRAVKLNETNRFTEALRAFRDGVKAARRRRMRERGMSEQKASDVETLDELIRSTAEPTVIERLKEQRRQKREEKEAAERAAQALEEAEAREREKLLSQKAPSVSRENAPLTGGTVKPEYAEDMPEFCADGVAETAIAAVLRELETGNRCTLVWYDSRERSGVCAEELATPEDFEAVYTRFSTAPVCEPDKDVTNLTLLVQESLNVTLRIVTSNLNPAALNRYSTVPSLFGGAGTGCVTEIVLFNPETRYESVADRREYVETCRSRLAHEGVLLTELRQIAAEDGSIHLTGVA